MKMVFIVTCKVIVYIKYNERKRNVNRSHFYAKLFQRVNLLKDTWHECIEKFGAKTTYNRSLSNSLVNKIKTLLLHARERNGHRSTIKYILQKDSIR